jgi:hypothetical protein
MTSPNLKCDGCLLALTVSFIFPRHYVPALVSVQNIEQIICSVNVFPAYGCNDGTDINLSFLLDSCGLRGARPGLPFLQEQSDRSPVP